MKVLSAYFDLETYSAHSPANRTTAWQECFELLDVSYTWIALSLTPSLPRVLPEWPYCQQAQCKHWFTDIQTSSHPQNSAYYLLGLQGLQQTPAFWNWDSSGSFIETFSEKNPDFLDVHVLRLSKLEIYQTFWEKFRPGRLIDQDAW